MNAQGHRPALKRSVGKRQLFSVAFGSIIGIGWITVLGNWIQTAGSLGAITAFLLGAIAVSLIGMVYAELAVKYPVSGGAIAYAYEIFGPGWSFLAGWLLGFSYIAVTIFEAVSVGWVAGQLFPFSVGPTLYTALGHQVAAGDLLFGIGIMIGIGYVNYRGGLPATRFQEWVTFGLIVLTLAFVSVELYGGELANLKPFFSRDPDGTVNWLGPVSLFATTAFWYAGFDNVPQLMGEVRGSRRFVPMIVVLSIGCAALFYIIVILGTAVALPRDVLLTSELPPVVAFSEASRLPAAGKLVLVAGLLGLISTWNAVFMSASRIVFALGRAQFVPAAFAEIHPRYGSPTRAVLFVAAVAGIGTLGGRNLILPIVSAATVCFSGIFLIMCVGVLKLRIAERDRSARFRAARACAVPATACLVALSMMLTALYSPFASGWRSFPVEWALVGGWIGLGLLFWRQSKSQRMRLPESTRRWLILGEFGILKEPGGQDKQTGGSRSPGIKLPTA